MTLSVEHPVAAVSSAHRGGDIRFVLGAQRQWNGKESSSWGKSFSLVGEFFAKYRHIRHPYLAQFGSVTELHS